MRRLFSCGIDRHIEAPFPSEADQDTHGLMHLEQRQGKGTISLPNAPTMPFAARLRDVRFSTAGLRLNFRTAVALD